MDIRSRSCFNRQTSEPDDAILPIPFERRVRDAFARRSVEKAVLIRDDAHMAKAVQEDERAEFEAVIAIDRLRLCPK